MSARKESFLAVGLDTVPLSALRTTDDLERVCQPECELTLECLGNLDLSVHPANSRDVLVHHDRLAVWWVDRDQMTPLLPYQGVVRCSNCAA